MRRRDFLAGTALAAVAGVNARSMLAPPAYATLEPGPGVKPASDYTKAANKRVLSTLPFSDRHDFDNARKGFIAGLPGDVFKDAQGKVVFDAKPFELPLDAPAPDSMNPSLWRISQLNGQSGLFKVIDRLYQVRNTDIANVTFIEGEKGVIVVDTASSAQAARAALDLYFQHRPKRPVTAVVVTHSHIDHFGGLAGVTTPEDVNAGRTRIIAPQGFLEEAVSENIFAGNAMTRRASYQYAVGVPKGPGPDQSLGSGLGIMGADEPPTFLPPTDTISETGQKMTIDGLEFEFLMTPGSEAPSEMHFYIPALKALCTAENAVHTMHNFYTLRGAKTRDVSKWVRYLNQTLDMWGEEAEVLYAPHHWPVWGNAEINRHIENYRDAFKFVHDRALHLANAGYTLPEIGTMVELPPELAANWATRGYYGTVSHNARAVYNFYLGYFSGNPAELNPLPPVEAAPRYVELMGGADAVIAKAKEAFDRGDYRWASQLLQHIVYAQPDNAAARNLQADAFEQLGYQSEAATWRNFYIVGAKELRHGVPQEALEVSSSPDLVKHLPLEMACDYLGIALDADKAAGKNIGINFVVEDTGEKRALTLRNRVVNSREKLLASPDLTLRGTGAALNAVLLGEDPDPIIDTGLVTFEGRREALADLRSAVTKFPFWFPIVTRPAMS